MTIPQQRHLLEYHQLIVNINTIMLCDAVNVQRLLRHRKRGNNSSLHLILLQSQWNMIFWKLSSWNPYCNKYYYTRYTTQIFIFAPTYLPFHILLLLWYFISMISIICTVMTCAEFRTIFCTSNYCLIITGRQIQQQDNDHFNEIYC
jgi:hypothetical protein